MSTIEDIKKKRDELSELHSRMDTDRDIVTLLPFVLKGFAEHLKGETIPNSVSVTLNKAVVFADSFISTLSSAKRQCEVTGLSDTANHDVEQFANSLMYDIDQKQVKQGAGNTAVWFSQHISYRGLIGYQLNIERDKEDKKVAIYRPSPMDMRWATWQEGEEDYDWVSNHTRRDGIELYGKYKDKKGSKVNLINQDKKSMEVENWYSQDKHEVWADDALIFEEDNTYGFIPCVIIKPLTGIFIEDVGFLKYRYEGILGLNRLIYDEWNRLASILQTMAVAMLYPVLASETEDGAPALKSYPYNGMLVPLKKGEKIYNILTPEISQAFLTALQNLDKALQQGGISDAELGDATMDRPGVWYTQQWTIRNRRMSPRMEAISQMYEEIVKLGIKEARVFNLKPKLKGVLYDSLPDPDDIEIKYRVMVEDRVMDVVRAELGKAMQGFLPDEYILRDIMHAEDPDGIMNEMALQRAKAENPVVYYRDTSRRLRVLAKEKYGQEKKNCIADAKMYGELMVQAMQQQAMQGLPESSEKVGQTGQAAALQAITGMMKGGNGNKPQLTQGREVMNAR
uniref:Portal protein n=1 Tax=viral metagenome TaxID=1070528 RepID=A0A6M3KPB7_9ZZZZ